ncbi:DUF6262 family protein [Bacillus cereus]|uniref:Transposase n=1 Tax=Bacillus cereus TaxID=1396 RepID=A0A9X6ZWZ9_BACCE|nr:DUF6262 family protein [Bacillus cereus]PFK07596.1 transposase [Bacillus cereus]
MEPYNRVTQLKRIHAQRKAATCQKVVAAIQRLIQANARINFQSVSNESGISKATLYNNLEIRNQIESLRDQQTQAPTSKQVQRELNDTNKDAIIETLKRKITKLENENKELKKQVKVAYAQIYEKL